jgi:hypothetical protein
MKMIAHEPARLFSDFPRIAAIFNLHACAAVVGGIGNCRVHKQLMARDSEAFRSGFFEKTLRQHARQPSGAYGFRRIGIVYAQKESHYS